MERYFITVVGLAYVGLGIWCAVASEKTSEAVGFTLRPGQGESEFFTAYGGLEVGLGLYFLWPLVRREAVNAALLACVLVHGSLVLFRTLSFFVFTGFETTTYVLASAEWITFLIAAALFFWNRRAKLDSSLEPEAK